MHQSSLEKMIFFKKKYLNIDSPLFILDLGSLDLNGSHSLWFDIAPWVYQGLDVTPGKNVDIVLKDPYCWKEIKSNSVDVLISGSTFEHIKFFWITILEIARVLKPGGLCCIIAPAEGPEHNYPIDCWRFLPAGFFALADFARLFVLEVLTEKRSIKKYSDGSNVWQDVMLICNKPYDSWKQQVLRWLLHKFLLFQVRDARKSTTTP